DTSPLRLSVQGPGALAVKIDTPFGSPASPLVARFELDGEPVRAKPYGIMEGAAWHEVLVNDGDSELAIVIATSGEDLEFGRPVAVSLAEIRFFPGYYVGSAVPWP